MEEPEGRSHPQTHTHTQTHIDQQETETYFAVDSSSYLVFKSKSSAWVVSSAVRDGKTAICEFPGDKLNEEYVREYEQYRHLIKKYSRFESF